MNLYDTTEHVRALINDIIQVIKQENCGQTEIAHCHINLVWTAEERPFGAVIFHAIEIRNNSEARYSRYLVLVRHCTTDCVLGPTHPHARGQWVCSRDQYLNDWVEYEPVANYPALAEALASISSGEQRATIIEHLLTSSSCQTGAVECTPSQTPAGSEV